MIRELRLVSGHVSMLVGDLIRFMAEELPYRSCEALRACPSLSLEPHGAAFVKASDLCHIVAWAVLLFNLAAARATVCRQA